MAMDYSGLVCVDLESKMGNRNESDTEDESKKESPRATAGFEWAAEPDEMLFPCCATKFIMLGVATTLVVVSILNWILSTYWSSFVWVTLSTLFMGLIIFLPEYFSNIINFAVNFCVWVAFSIFSFVVAIQSFVWRGEFPDDHNENHQRWRSRYLCAGIMGLMETVLAILVCILMFRMLYYYYQNRGDENIIAVAA